MKISTKGRYAVIAMIELALHDKKGLLPLAELSLAEDISISYLEQLFARLRSADLVNGVRGPRGGYRLAREAENISIAEIVKAADDKADPQAIANSETPVDKRELTQALWVELSKQMYDFLDQISLAQAVSHPQVDEFLGSAGEGKIYSMQRLSVA